MGSRKLRIAWFTHVARPGQPVATMSQYCTDLLVPLLRERFDIEIFCGLYSGEHCGVPRHHLLTAYQRHRAKPFDLFFYQLEDGLLGRSLRTQIGIMPGVTWVHDLYLSDLGAEGIHTSPWERSLAQYFNPAIPFSDRGAPPHQLRPQAFRETALSPVSLFSSRWGKREFDRWVTARLEHVPGGHRSEFLAVPVVMRERRDSLVGDNKLRVLAVGSASVVGRAHKFLPALAALKTPWHLTWMVEPTERDEAEVLLSEFGVSDRVSLIEGMSPQRWEDLLRSSDVALHLRSSPFGHLGPYLQLSMAAGVAAIVMRYASGEEIPQDAVFSIVPGMHETAQILGVLEALSRRDPRTLAVSAQALMRSENEVSVVARRMSVLFQSAAPALVEVMARWESLYAAAAHALLDEVRGFVDAPVGGMPGSYETIVAPFVEELHLQTL